MSKSAAWRSEHEDDVTDRAVRWILLEANRWLVTAVLSAILFGILVAVGTYGTTGFVPGESPVQNLFPSLVTALITGVTLVVTINQLVLSQELGAVEDQRDRLRGAMKFRADAESSIDRSISPTDPAAFLCAIVVAARTQATSLVEIVDDGASDAVRQDFEAFSETVSEQADRAERGFRDAEFGTFDVLDAALGYDYSGQIVAVRTLRSEYETAFSESADGAAEDLVTTLELFGIAREHFKTLYFQWALVRLSRAMMYVAIPALAVSLSIVLFVDLDGMTGASAGIEHRLLVVAIAVTLSVTPFFLLIAFLMRIATVAQRTLAIGPFRLLDE